MQNGMRSLAGEPIRTGKHGTGKHGVFTDVQSGCSLAAVWPQFGRSLAAIYK